MTTPSRSLKRDFFVWIVTTSGEAWMNSMRDVNLLGLVVWIVIGLLIGMRSSMAMSAVVLKTHRNMATF